VGFSDKILDWDGLPGWRARQRDLGKRLVATNGCFDILHVGHATYLEAARSHGDALLVGVNSDASVQRLKGLGRPLNRERDRAALVAALASVDAVCIFDQTTAVAFLEAGQPDVWAKGGDYTLDSLNQAERRAVERSGGKIVVIPLVPGHSTSKTLQQLGIL
jgi:rfaE bifunctional protein nucleotidyltransferase chain/domain